VIAIKPKTRSYLEVLLVGAAAAALFVIARTFGTSAILAATVAIPLAAGAFFLLQRPSGGAVVVGMVLFLPHLLIPPQLRFSESLQYSLLLLTFALIYWSVGSNRPPIPTSAVGGFVLLGMGPLLFADSSTSVLTVFGSLSLVMTLVAGLLVGAGAAANGRPALLAIGAVAAISAVLAVAEIFGLPNFWLPLVHATSYEGLGSRGGNFRALGTVGHPLVSGVGLACLGILMLGTRSARGYSFALLLLIGSLATVTRSALMGALVGGIALLYFRRSEIAAWVVRLTAGAAVLVGIAAASETVGQSLWTRVFQQSGTADQQLRIFSLSVLEDKLSNDPFSLLVGGGPGSVGRIFARVGPVDGLRVLDNQYITMIVVSGLLVLVASAVLVGNAVAEGSRQSREIGVPALAVLVVAFAFSDLLSWKLTAVLLGFTVGIASSARTAYTGSEDGAR
jgi:hypothetical protein